MSPNSKRNHKESFQTPSPSHPVNKKLDLKSTPKSRLQPMQSSARPIYPSTHDKRDLVSVVNHFTKLALEADLGDERKEKDEEHSADENLIIKVERRKMAIVGKVDTCLTELLMRELGNNDPFDFSAAVTEAKGVLANAIFDVFENKDDAPASQMVAKMTEYAGNALLVELMSSNLVPSPTDTATIINSKRELLRLTNPYRSVIINIINDMLTQGVTNKLSIVRSAGLLANLNETYHSIHNSLAESEKRIDLMTDQIGNLTQTLTDQDNSESHRMLVLRGITEVIQTKEAPGPQVRAAREMEAAAYIRETIGFKGSFTISLPPARSKGSGIAILTTAFDQDKFRLERMISSARKSNLTTISSKRWTPVDKPYSNLPNPEVLASQLKIGMKHTLTQQLTALRATPDPKNHELADWVETTFSNAIKNHDYHPRKQIYGKENSVQYEFLCPVAKGIMMIYKGDLTFEGYDFLDPIPNPRLRELVKSDPSLKEKHNFQA